MFTIQAGHPLPLVTSVLPNPRFSNSEASVNELTVKRAVTGFRRTYIRRRSRKRSIWSFALTRQKALELRELFLNHHSARFLITDHEGRQWVGQFTNNPFEFDTPSRAAGTTRNGVRAERQSITLEFEGVEQ